HGPAFTLAQGGDHVARTVFDRNCLHPRRGAGALHAFVPPRWLQRLDQGTDWVAAGGKSGTSHVPIADVAGGEDHDFAVCVRGVDVFPAVDANVFHQVTRLEVR